MAEDRIDTVIDRFLEFVRQNKKVSLSETASALALSQDKAEQIASLLENNNLIEVRYGLTSVTLISKQKQLTLKTEKKSAPQDTKSAAVDESQRLEKEILNAEGLLKFFEKDLERRILKSEHLLHDLESRKDLSREEVLKVKEEIQLAMGQLAAFSSEIKELMEKEEAFYSKLEEFNRKLDSLGKVKNLPSREVPDTLSKLKGILKQLSAWVKKLFSNLTSKKKTKPAKRLKQRQPPVVFLGSGEESWKSVKKPRKSKRRVLEVRVDRVKQHYWRKSKR